MTAINQVGNPLTGSTGTGNFVGATSPSITTPTITTSLTFSPTTGGIVGTTTNDNTTALNVGEYISSIVLVGSSVSLTDSTAKTITSISLTAGDWDVWAEFWLNPGAGTTTSNTIAAIYTTTDTLPSVPADGTSYSQFTVAVTASNALVVPVSPARISLSGTTTIYLVGRVSFAVNTMGGYGKICARRRR